MKFKLDSFSFVLLLYLVCIATKTVLAENSVDSAVATLEFVNNALKKLDLSSNQRIHLMIGNTGCGKTTLIHYIACDYSKLISKEPPNPNSIDFIIRDELDPDVNITISSTVSRTLIPEKIVDNEKNVVWYDLPGIGDTRNETVEIAAAFLIKKVIESASSAKFVLVVNYASVTYGNDRDDFDSLLSSAVQLIKNVKHFEESVSLVVTKTPSFKMRGRRFIDIFDDSVKNTTAEFMSAHRTVLHEKGSNQRRKIQLIDALLTQSADGDYPKISIFWRPNDVGPFDIIDKMIVGRAKIRESILNFTSYTEIRPNDFGFVLTAKAEIKVRTLAQHLIDSISTSLQRIIHNVLVELQQQIESIGNFKKRLEFIERGQNCFNSNNEINEREAISLNELIELLKRLIRTYNVKSIDMPEFNQIEEHENHFNILNSLMQTDTTTTPNGSTIASATYQPHPLNYDLFSKQIVVVFGELENEAQTGIKNKSREIIENISMILMSIDNRILMALQKQLISTNGFQNRLELLQKGRNSMNTTKDEITLKKRTDQFVSLIQTFGIRSVHLNELNRIERSEKHLLALKSITQIEIILPVRDWDAISSKAINYQASMYDWYAFLAQTFQYFGSYDVQRNVAAYNVAKLSDWGQINKPAGLFINERNFDEFTKRIARSADFVPTPSHLAEINEIINTTLNSPLQYACNGRTMTIHGTFVKSSDIQLSKCPTGNDIITINVYVADTFYVDGNLYLNKTKEVQLNILATKWHILQDSTFYLNGIDGKMHPKLTSNGMAGMPGNHGTNGGHFFGLTMEIINGDLLKVETNGGRGGNGQDGTGNPDVQAVFNENAHSGKGPFDSRTTSPDNYYKRYFRENGYDADMLSSKSRMRYFALLAVGSEIWHTFRIYSSRCCGSTGTGGDGGSGSNRGSSLFLPTSTLLTAEQTINYNFFPNNNINGLPQRFRTDGSNGTHGSTARVCKSTALELKIDTVLDEFPFYYKFSSEFYDKNRIDNPRCYTNYVYNTTKIPVPKEVHDDPFGSMKSAFFEYKSFLLENMKNPILLKIIQKAYDAINSNLIINSLYTSKEFAIEANALEKEFFELNKCTDVLPLYDDLLNRIANYSTVKASDLSNVDRKVVGLLYSTLLSKTTGLRSGHRSDLIINIEEFLDIIVRNIEKFNEIGRIEMINRQRDDYNEEILTKIREANNYIDNDIQPEIENIFAVLNENLQKTVNETITLESKTIKEILKKKAQAIIIRRNAETHGILGIIKSIAGFVTEVCKNLFGKVTSAAANAIATSIDENLVDPKITKNAFPLAVARLRIELRKNYQEKIDAIEFELKKLENSSKTLNLENHQFNDELSNLTAKVFEIRSHVPVEHHDVSYVLKECIEFTNGWQYIFSIQPPDEATGQITRLLQKTVIALAVIASSTSSYREYSSDSQRLDEIGKAINDDRDTLIALIRFEDEIYAELMPTVDELHETLTNIQENLEDKSSVALNVIQWKIRDTLRAVQKKLGDGVSGFETEYDVNNCLVRVNEAIHLIINIYDRIQSYEEHSKFASYLSDIQSANYQNLDVSDDQIRKNINELQQNIKANLILAQYYRAIDAFKQAVFPYAADYLDVFDLPDSLNVTDLHGITAITAEKIRLVSEKIKEFNTTVINEKNQDLHIAYFNNEPGSPGPFFVWQNHQVHNKIEQLFNGKRIYLYADILRSGEKNAIKFNVVDLAFRSNNQSINNYQLNEILKSFHVSLTHMGESNYRCNNDIYGISSRSLRFDFSFADKKGAPIDQNSAHEKLKNGMQLLSPYTMWTVQLSHGQFEKLKPFTNFVNIELHGHGQYVIENADICRTNLQKYYSLRRNW